ncbi:MAG: hypothetical protein AAGI51_15500 [Pseudomonadota bacterium]
MIPQRLAAILLAGLCAAPPAAAQTPEPGSETLCTGYDETYEGVWRDRDGADILRFRFGANADGTGCYAWLSASSHFNLDAAGSVEGAVAPTEDILIFHVGRTRVGLRPSTGEALYKRGGSGVVGVLTSPEG